MKLLKINILTLIFLGLITSSHAQDDPEAINTSNQDIFNKYWFDGNGEINFYDLSQSRYGELRNGSSVLVYVIEDFCTDKQVKYEKGEKTNTVSILKMNRMSRFPTGIYDYSLMTSIFTPIDNKIYPYTLKSTFSVQDWCGQSFSQMNNRDGKMTYLLRSYFQEEGDNEFIISPTYLEEDIWTRIRMNPQALPLGKIQMLPSQEYLLLHHKEIKPYEAIAKLNLHIEDAQSGGKEFYMYELLFPALDRKLIIKCESDFPYQIVEWEEHIKVSEKDENFITKATLQNTLKKPYWQLIKNEHSGLRQELGF